MHMSLIMLDIGDDKCFEELLSFLFNKIYIDSLFMKASIFLSENYEQYTIYYAINEVNVPIEFLFTMYVVVLYGETYEKPENRKIGEFEILKITAIDGRSPVEIMKSIEKHVPFPNYLDRKIIYDYLNTLYL